MTLLAVDVGVYVWARQAFAFLQPSLIAELVPTLERYLFSQRVSAVVDDDAIRESWDLANFDVPEVAIDAHRVGKAFMLDCAPAWHGMRMLDDARHDRVAEASRRETFARLPAKIDGASAELAVR